jgi:hypothetical protein
MSDQPIPANMNIDTVAVMLHEGTKVSLGLSDALVTLQTAAPREPAPKPRLTIIQGGRESS